MLWSIDDQTLETDLEKWKQDDKEAEERIYYALLRYVCRRLRIRLLTKAAWSELGLGDDESEEDGRDDSIKPSLSFFEADFEEDVLEAFHYQFMDFRDAVRSGKFKYNMYKYFWGGPGLGGFYCRLAGLRREIHIPDYREHARRFAEMVRSGLEREVCKRGLDSGFADELLELLVGRPYHRFRTTQLSKLKSDFQSSEQRERAGEILHKLRFEWVMYIEQARIRDEYFDQVLYEDEEGENIEVEIPDRDKTPDVLAEERESYTRLYRAMGSCSTFNFEKFLVYALCGSREYTRKDIMRLMRDRTIGQLWEQALNIISVSLEQFHFEPGEVDALLSGFYSSKVLPRIDEFVELSGDDKRDLNRINNWCHRGPVELQAEIARTQKQDFL